MESYEGNEKKGGKPKWFLWVIIGIVAIVVIGAVVALKPGGGQSSTSGLTIDDLSAQINTLSATLTPIVLWKATAVEDIANLKARVNTIAAPRDWTADFAALGADITDLRNEWAGVNQTIRDAIESMNVTMLRYAMVSGMEEKLTGIYIDILVYGAGSYPVLVSLYGQDLQNCEVYVKPNTGCKKVGEYAFYNYVLSGNETLSGNAIRWDFVIVPTTEWESRNLVQLKVVGNATVSYAFAVVGDSWAEAEEEW